MDDEKEAPFFILKRKTHVFIGISLFRYDHQVELVLNHQDDNE